MRSACVGFAAVLAVCMLAGCSNKAQKRELAPAKGVVTYKGKALENARVAFLLKDSTAEFSYGVTDAQGQFKMSTYGINDGAIIGKHKVTISKVDVEEQKVDTSKAMEGGYIGSMPGYESMMGVGGKKAEAPKDEVPKKYSDAKTSQIEVEVKKDEASNDFKFDLD